MTRKWVLNASPLIVLSRISCVDMIRQLCSEIVVPSGVADEIMRGGSTDPARLWMNNAGHAHMHDVACVDDAIASWDLGLGESRVLTYAYANWGCEAVLDDRAARTCAAALDIPVRGTLGILLLAKRKGNMVYCGHGKTIAHRRSRPLAPRDVSRERRTPSVHRGERL